MERSGQHPMLRHLTTFLFTAFSTLCLLLCLATACLWVRSYETRDILSYVSKHGEEFGFAASRGDLLFTHLPSRSQGFVTPRFRHRIAAPASIDPANLPNTWWTFKADMLAGVPPTPAFRRSTWENHHFAGFAYQIHWDWTGDYWRGIYHRTRIFSRLLLVPAWFVCLLLALPPAWWLWWLYRRLRQRYRRRKGLCFRCGYDLRASTEHCPECGEPIAGDVVRSELKDQESP